MSEALFLGVDGGGTKTALCLVTPDGRVAAHRIAGSVYYAGQSVDLVADVLTPAVAALCADAGVTPASVTHAFFALPGYGESSTDRPLLDAAPLRVLGHDRYSCDNDMVAGWAGSLGALDGINVISGTGSMTYGERQGRRVRVGGWGALFGDEGSAHWIAVRGLNAFSRMSDGRLPPGPLLEVLLEHLRLPSDLDLVDVVLLRWRSDRARVAGLCRQVVEAADAGDEVAAAILDEAAHELALLVSRTRAQLGFTVDDAVRVSWSGGTFAADRIREGFSRALLAQHPNDDLREPLLPPVIGAALYAARLAGRPLDTPAFSRLTAATRTLPTASSTA
ncbi:N-acetylglucosamine kinase [Microlunatus antarcticus]|uniref:N-acetylglucosamine kinase-like BadF-type ATPase n=1 Tax=Microlunatus antarcticus TaxID=53388 RepID=A0A7W5JYC2_9ACTN|nr:BadF/BadG/BcrA/BcrD ATPase family protein [Microlunatus antarcticus]MBB3328573.1 N-acetylglucosamine kinase-like BadF-type ATPase [Microlunatus antarcticus]